MESLICSAFAVLFAAFVIWFAITRGGTILQDWADKNGYQLLHKEFRVFRVGPFWGQSGQGVVYYVTVRDEQGQQRSGWGWKSVHGTAQ